MKGSDVIEGLIETLLSQFRQLLQAGSESALEMVLNALRSQPTPTLNEDIFRSLYVRVWGFAVLASLLTGMFGILLSSTSRRRGLTFGQSLTYFLRVYVQAFLLPLAVAVGIALSNLLVDAALSAAPVELKAETLANLPGMVGVADELLATLLAFLNWILGWTLALWVLVLTWGVLPLMVVAVALSPLAPLGKDPGGFMRRSYIWLAVAITARVVVALVLMIGTIFVGLIGQLGIELVGQLFQLATLIVALWLSFGLRTKFDENDVIAVWIPTPITASVTGSSVQTAPANLHAVRSGLASSRQHYQGHQAQQPARIRRAVATGLSTTAAAAPDPRVKHAATVGSLIFGRSARKAESKAEGANNDGA